MATAARKPKSKAGAPFFFWRKSGGRYLLTNDFGYYAWLDGRAFARYASGKLGVRDASFRELERKGFIRDRLDFSALAARWKGRNARVFAGPGLHILILTRRCNYACGYCQAGGPGAPAGADMSWKTARRCVDFAFRTPSSGLTLEFQGGEPLLNWGVLKKAVLYARRKEKAERRKLSIGLVSNFSLMTEERARFLLANEVSLCTSLDGPAALHNANRPYSGGNSHAACVKWLKYFSRRNAAGGESYRIFKPSALLTVTRASLPLYREIVDEYVSLGLEEIFARPLAPMGRARDNWDRIGYSPAEFAAFYGRMLGYILALNRKGVRIREKLACILLEKIEGAAGSGYTDLACPCGAATGQIAYDADGGMYTCDEGRMLGGDAGLFRLGGVSRTGYGEAVSAPAARACASASELHAQPSCARCAYSPYCGVCPVYNFAAQGGLWGNMPVNDRCAVMKGVFDALFAALEKPAARETLLGWLK